jgi:predicted metalloprotease with PDZ domain
MAILAIVLGVLGRKRFFHDRVQVVAAAPPLNGLSAAGWKLVYDDKPNLRLGAFTEVEKLATFSYSLGFSFKVEGDERGYLADVLLGSPAAKAGIGPGMTLVGVNGRKLGKDTLGDALKLGRGAANKAPLELLVLNGDYFRSFKVDYHDGPRHPHLQAVPGAGNLLDAIIKPRQPSMSPAK